MDDSTEENTLRTSSARMREREIVCALQLVAGRVKRKPSDRLTNKHRNRRHRQIIIIVGGGKTIKRLRMISL